MRSKSVLNMIAALVAVVVAPGLSMGAADVKTLAGVRMVELDMAGWVEDWSTACPRAPGAAARCEIFFLVRDSIDTRDRMAEANGPPARATFKELVKLEPLRLVRLARAADGSPGDLEIVLEGIEPETRLAMLDVDLDGRPDPLLVSRGRARSVRLGDGVAERPLIESPLIELPGAPASGLLSSLDPFSGVLAWARVGEVVFYRLEGGGAREIARRRLPVSARVGATTLRLETPEVRRVAGSDEIFVVGPEEQGPSRWRVNLFRPTVEVAEEGENGDDRQMGEEIWLRTPGPERPVRSQFFERDGQLFLLAQALRSDKVGIVERKKVRLYPLRADRTRSGVAPVFEQMSVSRMWQDLETALQDHASKGHDSNGKSDLTLLQREGFSGKKLQVDQFVQQGGRLSTRSRRSLIKVPWAEWSYARDLTGDGVKDLLLQSEGLHLVAGRGVDEKTPFENQPRWFLPLPDARAPGVEVSISLGPEGGTSESSEMSGADVSSEEEALDSADEADEEEEEDPGIRWGRPHFVSPEGVEGVEILLLGNERSRRRGGSHVVLLVEPTVVGG